MIKLKELTKSIIVHLMIFSLVQTSFPVSIVYAADVTKNPVFQAAQMGMGMVQQAYQMKWANDAQIRQNMIDAQLYQSLMPQPTVSKFFPQCKLPPTMVNIPKNACPANVIPDVASGAASAAVQKMMTYTKAAESSVNFYDQMLNEATNSPITAGMRCLKDNQKAVDSQITEMINNLTRLQDRLNQDKQVFRDNNKKLLDDLAVTNSELFGTDKKDINLKTMDPSKYFSKSCQSAIGKDALTKSGNGNGFVGFNGILEIMSSKNKSASDFNQNKSIIENDLRRDIEKMQAGIKNSGLADWVKNVSAPGSAGDISGMPTVLKAANKSLTEFNTSYERISNELKKDYNYEAPKLDKNFTTDFADFVSSSKDYFKKKYVNECVTGADKGIAIPYDQLVSSMTTTLKGSIGNNYLESYRQAYKAIMSSDDSVEDKDQQLKALAVKFPNIHLRYTDSNASIVIETPYQTFMKTAQKCADNYNDNQETKVNRGQVLLRELQSLHDNFSSNLGQSVMEKVMNCNGEAKKAGATCSEDTLNHKSDNFCLQQASECANEIQGCYAEAEKQVETRKNKMATIAKTYNANVQAMVTRANQLLTQQKAAVTEMTKLIQAKFPGSNFPIPNDLFVAMPEMKKEAFGIELANDGNLSFLDDLSKKVGLLKDMFEKQQQAADKQIEDYINDQKMAMEKEKGRLERVASECRGSADKIASAANEYNKQGMEAQQKRDAAANGWCAKYSDLKSHPNGACEKAKSLTKDMDKVVGMITYQARSVALEMEDVCNQYNNEKDDDALAICQDLQSRMDSSDEDDDSEGAKKEFRNKRCKATIARANLNNKEQSSNKKLKLTTLCQNAETSDSEFFKKVAEEGYKNNEKERSIIAKISNVKDLESQLENLSNEDFFKSVLNLAGEGDICKNLHALNKPDSKIDQEIKQHKSIAETYSKQTDEDLTKIAKAEVEGRSDVKPEDVPRLIKESVERSKAAVKTAIEESQAKVNELSEKKGKSSELNELLSSFYPPAETKDDTKRRKIGELGEQVEESCLAQASNNNMPKMFNSSDMLMKFDQSILGKSK